MSLEKKLYEPLADNTLYSHDFNITDKDSMFFYAEAVHVERAELFINDMLMSVVVLGKGEPVDSSIPPQRVQLEFFDAPLHRALLKCPVKIRIHTYDSGIPSITMEMVDTTTWERLDANEYVVDVSVSTARGRVGKKMVYCPMFAGYAM